MGFSAPPTAGIPAKVEDMVMGEVKRAFNPEFLNRLDEVILFTSLTDEDLLKIIHLLVDQINMNLVAKQIKIRLHRRRGASTFSRRRCTDRSYGARPLAPRPAEVHRGSAVGGSIQGSLPRPAELEVYLGDTGIFCRPDRRSSRWEPGGLARSRSRWRGLRCICSKANWLTRALVWYRRPSCFRTICVHPRYWNEDAQSGQAGVEPLDSSGEPRSAEGGSRGSAAWVRGAVRVCRD